MSALLWDEKVSIHAAQEAVTFAIEASEREQFHAPYRPQRVANGELGTLEKIGKGKLTIKLDSGRRVSFEIDKNRCIDHGYAVTSHSPQGQTVNRVLVNADTSEPDKLLNRRMAYIAGSATPSTARGPAQFRPEKLRPGLRRSPPLPNTLRLYSRPSQACSLRRVPYLREIAFLILHPLTFDTSHS